MSGLSVLTTSQVLLRLNQEPQDGIYDLRNIDFREVNIRQKELRERFEAIAKIARAAGTDHPIYIDFSGSNLTGRGFYELDLSHTLMNSVNAERAVFAGSDLSDVQFDNSNLNYADMRYTKLNFTKFHNTSIVGVNFTGADLSTARGLNFGSTDREVIERLGVVGRIYDAKLPPEVEKIRNKLIAAISSHFPRKKRNMSVRKVVAANSGATASEW